MKRFFLLLMIAAFTMSAFGASRLSSFRGVWANDKAEAVITDSVCIFFEKKGNVMEATIETPDDGYVHKTLFSPEGSVTFPSDVKPLDIVRSDGKLTINGQQMELVEAFKTSKPYNMSQCMKKTDVGKCLQQWRLGTKMKKSGDQVFCEINTNRHMLVYMVAPSTVYIRAAATRNNDNGTLFAQNIRMMKNNNTGEYTMHIYDDNLAKARDNLQIDNTKFTPDACNFTDEGIYWSLISFSPDMILINGCGETYQVPRPEKTSDLIEWIAFQPY